MKKMNRPVPYASSIDAYHGGINISVARMLGHMHK